MLLFCYDSRAIAKPGVLVLHSPVAGYGVENMDADLIILCDDIILPGSKKEIDGGVAVAGGQVVSIGVRGDVSGYLGIDTQVVEYHNSTLFTFGNPQESQGANIVVVAGNKKRKQGKIGKMVKLLFLMYQGDIVFQKEV